MNFIPADYAFPYLSVIISMISNAAHFSLKLDQSMKSLLRTSVTEMKNTVIIGDKSKCVGKQTILREFYICFFFFAVGHWILLAYGIISLHQHLALLFLVPLPAIFYIVTVTFTDPSEFLHVRNDRNT